MNAEDRTFLRGISTVTGRNAYKLEPPDVPTSFSGLRSGRALHEIAHSFGLGDEYAQTDTSFPGTAADLTRFGNLQTEGDTIVNGQFNADQIKWNWFRARKGALLTDVISIGVNRWRVNLVPGHGLPFAVGDKVILRKRDYPNPLGKNPIETVTKDASGRPIVLEIDDPRSGDFVTVVGAIDHMNFVEGDVLYMPTPAPESVRSEINPFAGLIAKNIKDFINTKHRSLSGPACDPEVSKQDVQDPDLPGVDLPICFSEKPRIVGMYYGGNLSSCGIFHPAGSCMMHGREYNSEQFCAVCRYLLVEIINPFHHFQIDFGLRRVLPNSMSDTPGTLESIGRHLTLALDPLRLAVSDPERFKQFMLRLGWEVTSLPPEYVDLGARVEAAVQALEAFPDEPSSADVSGLLNKIKEVYVAFQAISVAPAGVDPGEFLPELGALLFELLWTDYLAASLPEVYNLLLAVDVIELENSPPGPTRQGYIRTHFKWDQIPQIVGDPLSLLSRVYGWGTPHLDYVRILDHLTELLVAVRLPVAIRTVGEELTREYSGIPVEPLTGPGVMLRLPFYYLTILGTPREFAFAVRELPAAPGRLPGLVVEPDIPSELPLSLRLADDIELKIRAGSDLASHFGILIRPDGISVKYPFQPGQELPRAGFGLAFDFHPETNALLLGSPGATRLEVAGAEAGLQVDYLSGQLEFILSAEVRGLALVLAAGEGDSFLRDVVGRRRKAGGDPLGVEWSSTRGLHFKGGGGFEVEVPSHIELGPILVRGHCRFGCTRRPSRAAPADPARRQPDRPVSGR